MPAKPSEKFDEGGELDVGSTFFHAGDEALLGSDSVGQLLLGKTGAEPLFFELLSDNEGVALYLELIPLRGSNQAEVLSNKVFDRCQVHLLEALHLLDCLLVFIAKLTN